MFVACKALEIDSQPQKPRLVSKLGLLRGVGLEAVVETSNTAGVWHHADSTADCSDPDRRGCTGKIRPGLKRGVLGSQRHATVRTELIPASKILDLGNGSSKLKMKDYILAMGQRNMLQLVRSRLIF